MIKNIVVGSGAQDIAVFLGILDELIKSKYVKLENIESLYGTSAGSIILLAIALKTDWDTFVEYATKKPWNHLSEPATKALFKIFNDKGILDQSVVEDIFIPILKTRGLKKNITFKELYEYSKIEYNIYSFNLNEFKGECFNHIKTPDLEVLKGVYMSCSLPIIFKPMYYNGSYYFDGGLEYDCPLNPCLKEKNEKETVCIRKKLLTRPLQAKLGEESSLIEYLLIIISKMISYRRDEDNLGYENAITYFGKEAWNELIDVFSDEKVRIEKIELGRRLSKEYLLKKQH